MTTEHVSVPRTVEDVRNWHLHQLRTLKEAWQPYEHHKTCSEILSRATPSDVCKTCNGKGYVNGWGAMGHREEDCPDCHGKPSAPRVVTDDLVRQLRGRAEFLRDMGRIKSPQLMEQAANVIESFATSLPGAVPDGELRLWDTQWMSIVNHDNCYRDWSKDDAIVHAVKMTEQAIARNIADGKLPPKKTAAAPQAGETK